jgi:hypothetical protein
MLPRIFAFVAVLGIAAFLDAHMTPPDAKSPREALQTFSDLIGDWKCTGTPNGTREEIQKGFWTEKMSWEWQFKDKDAWLKLAFEKGKNFTGGELRYVPDKDHFTLTLNTVKKEKITYIGNVEMRDKTKIVTFEREVGKDTERFVFTLLHNNVYNYRYEEKPDGRPLFRVKWKVLATKEGEAFATGSGKPECIVSGGAGTSPVTYMGKTYYVCCSGCRDEFNASPAKYVKEFEEKQAKAKKK